MGILLELPVEPPLTATNVVGVTPRGLVERWARVHPSEALRILELRSFADGTRVHVRAERRTARSHSGGTYHAWSPLEWILDAATGATVAGKRPPWIVADEELASIEARALQSRASPHDPVERLALRAVSRDGTQLVFLLARNWREWPDPDAGTVVSCDATLALWDVRADAFRWETSAVPPEMGCGAWLFEQAGYSFSFDESGVFGLVRLAPTATLHDVATGALRRARPTDFLPQPRRPAGAAPVQVIAADMRAARAVTTRAGLVEVWNLVDDRVVGAVTFGEGAEPTAATVLGPTTAIVVGTADGHLLRFDAERPGAEPAGAGGAEPGRGR